MRAGRLRHRVELQSPSETANAFGEVTDSWATDATVWASIEPLSGSEGQIAKQTNPLVTHRVIMRYRSGVTPRNRVKFGTRIFEVTQVFNPDERGESLRLVCVEDI